MYSYVLTVFGYFDIYVDTSTKGEMIVGKTFVNCQVKYYLLQLKRIGYCGRDQLSASFPMNVIVIHC